MTDNREFEHNKASGAIRTEGLREIFEYRDPGIKAAIRGDHIARIVKADGRK